MSMQACACNPVADAAAPSAGLTEQELRLSELLLPALCLLYLILPSGYGLGGISHSSICTMICLYHVFLVHDAFADAASLVACP